MDDRKSKMLDRVRKLLAKANDSAVGEAEAESFRAKADEIMTSFAIETWEVEMAKEGERVKPVRRDLDYGWYKDAGYDNPVRDALWSMFFDVARHCRVIIVTRKQDFKNGLIPCIGMDADLDYFDMVFTSLMLQLVAKADPRPLARLSLEENLAMMREAGLGWDTVTKRMMEAGMVEDPTPDLIFPSKRADWKHYCRERFLVSERLVGRYRSWCKATGRPQTYTNVATYRREFAGGFSGGIWERLAEMRRASAKVYDEGHKSGGAELALRDIAALVKDALYEFYPDLKPPPPHPASCDCDACHNKKCVDPACKRPICVQKRKPIRYRADNRKVDWAARAAGGAAAREANLTGRSAGSLRKTPELDK